MSKRVIQHHVLCRPRAETVLTRAAPTYPRQMLPLGTSSAVPSSLRLPLPCKRVFMDVLFTYLYLPTVTE